MKQNETKLCMVINGYDKSNPVYSWSLYVDFLKTLDFHVWFAKWQRIIGSAHTFS